MPQARVATVEGPQGDLEEQEGMDKWRIPEDASIPKETHAGTIKQFRSISLLSIESDTASSNSMPGITHKSTPQLKT